MSLKFHYAQVNMAYEVFNCYCLCTNVDYTVNTSRVKSTVNELNFLAVVS